MNGNTVHKNEITILGTLDGSGMFRWVVDPCTLSTEDRQIVEQFHTRYSAPRAIAVAQIPASAHASQSSAGQGVSRGQNSPDTPRRHRAHNQA